MFSLLKTKINFINQSVNIKTDIRDYCFQAVIFWVFNILFTNFIILLKSVPWKNI